MAALRFEEADIRELFELAMGNVRNGNKGNNS